jgi:predicted FMN-binding regulatory protein PaiB
MKGLKASSNVIFARANLHWKELAEGDEALMIFQGPEGYITPRITTWNG